MGVGSGVGVTGKKISAVSPLGTVVRAVSSKVTNANTKMEGYTSTRPVKD